MEDKGKLGNDLPRKGKGIRRRLFTSSKQKCTTAKVLHTISSLTSYYINYQSLSNNKSPTTIVGKNIPYVRLY